jgi:hypothetical protein
MAFGAKEKLATDLRVGDEVLAVIYDEDVSTPWTGPREVMHVQRVEDDGGRREVRLRYRHGSGEFKSGQRLLVLTEGEV